MSGSGIVPAVLAAVIAAAVLGAWVAVLLRRRRSAVTAGPGLLREVPFGPGPGSSPDAATVPDVRPAAAPSDLPVDLAAPRGSVLLLQVAARYCADSRAAREVLADVTAGVPGTVVREIDIDHRPELMGRLTLRTTPTTVLYDGAGLEYSRFVGVPRRAALLDALAAARGAGPDGGRRAG